MQADIETIAEEVLELPPNARAYLAEIILQYLDYEDEFTISQEWMDEIHHCCHKIDKGQVQLVKAEDTLDQLQKNTDHFHFITGPATTPYPSVFWDRPDSPGRRSGPRIVGPGMLGVAALQFGRNQSSAQA